MVGIEAPSIRVKAFEIAAVIENRDVLGNAKFFGFRHGGLYHFLR